MHPIVSTAGIGRRATEICSGAHYEGFGYQSTWGRMHRMDVLFLTLGLDLRSGLSFAHYIESLYGVPYQYCKVYSTPVLSGGERIDGTFTMRVRFLDYSIAYDLSQFQQILLDGGDAHSSICGRSVIQSVRASIAFEKGLALLESDIYGFLMSKPQFREGEIPFDGATGSPGYLYDSSVGLTPDRKLDVPPQPEIANFETLRRRTSMKTLNSE